ncbi:MAG: hypothetical protein CMB80_16985 [Flammeovirgaceae bacterium]|nr:hypothetical protein [Flammeovirgaceae bacterium]MBR07715.1 hypothetical protein [Rickettsiales bacterium]HCX20611.1 hypothetical protein [Cytophagales bacterium]|tara:strand:+ start:26 stop:415 length:390 start_codon:yes stop_codon:yes gene_type:complete
MGYYISTEVKGDFNEVVEKVIKELSNEGFGVLTEINITETLKKKLGVDLYNYKILGACNPPYAYKAIQAENKIGTMLPCNVIVQEREGGKIEVSAVDPIASMQAVKNESLEEIAIEISEKLKSVIVNVK